MNQQKKSHHALAVGKLLRQRGLSPDEAAEVCLYLATVIMTEGAVVMTDDALECGCPRAHDGIHVVDCRRSM